MTPEEIYDLYGEKMFQYAALRLGSSEDAEDVLQEAFYRLSRFSVRRLFILNPKAFVYKVLRNEINRFLRRKLRRPPAAGLMLEAEGQIADFQGNPAFAGGISGDRVLMGNPGEVSPAGGDSGLSLSALTAGALAALPGEQREVVILKIFQDLSFKEIASVCGLSINTAASRYRYALEKLRASIEKEK